MLGLVACDNEANNNTTNNTSANAGSNNTEQKPPESNFIPINDPDSVCQDAEAARPVLDGLFAGSSVGMVASNIEICNDGMRSTCGGCAGSTTHCKSSSMTWTPER